MTTSDIPNHSDTTEARHAVVDRYGASARVAPSAACRPTAVPTESQPLEFAETMGRAVRAKSGGELHYGTPN